MGHLSASNRRSRLILPNLAAARTRDIKLVSQLGALNRIPRRCASSRYGHSDRSSDAVQA